MSGRDDEEEMEAWRRLAAERANLSPVDRAHGRPPFIAADGARDGRSERRTGRVVQVPFRTTLKVRAKLRAIKKRDGIASDPVFLELMLEAYQEKYGRLAEEALPSDEELIERFEREQDRRHGGSDG